MNKVITISEASSIALHAMVLIAKSKNPINTTKVSKLSSSSKHHVAKVLQTLVRHGFLMSKRGPSGGFLLSKQPKVITFYDVYTAIEGPIKTKICPFDKPTCPFGNCIFDNVLQKMTNTFVDYLKSQTIDMHV